MSKRLIALLVAGLVLFVISPALVQAQDDDQCIVLHPGGAWEYVTCDDPTPTETPSPTSTPTATSTPSPTNTPTATAISTPAATWEPTAEIVTPAPTDIASSATPQFTGCELRALSAINIRSGHSTNYPVIGSWTTDDTDPREFVEFYDGDRDYLWGRGTDGGWTVVYDKPASAWWAAGTVAAWAKCPLIDGWPVGLEPPAEFASNAALLWHAVPGANAYEMEASYYVLDSKDIEFGVKSYADINLCLTALNMGGYCIWRHGNPDCPGDVGTGNPVDSALNFIEYDSWVAGTLAQYDKAYIEPINECWYGNTSHPEIVLWWAEWLATYIEEAQARGFPKLVIPTQGVANSEAIHFAAWKTVLQHSADDGNLYGEHIYTPYHDEGLCSCDEWLACRHRTDQEIRLEMGLDIRVAITEAAKGWGNDPVDVNDFVCWYETVRGDSWVHSVSLWTSGYNATWPNAMLDYYMVEIASDISAN